MVSLARLVSVGLFGLAGCTAHTPSPPGKPPPAPDHAPAPAEDTAFAPGAHPYWVLEGPASTAELQPTDFAAIDNDVYADTNRFVDLSAGARLRFGPTADPIRSCVLRGVPVVGQLDDALQLRLVVGGTAYFPTVPRADLEANIVERDIVVYSDAGEPLALVSKGSLLRILDAVEDGFVRVCADPPDCAIQGIAATPPLTQVYDLESSRSPYHDVDAPEIWLDRDLPFSVTDPSGAVLIKDLRAKQLKFLNHGEMLEVIFIPSSPRHDSNRLVVHGYISPSDRIRIESEPDHSSSAWTQKRPAPSLPGTVVHPKPNAWLFSSPDESTKFARTIYSTPVVKLPGGVPQVGWVELAVETPWGPVRTYMRRADVSPDPPIQPASFSTQGKLIPNRCVAG